MPPVSRAQNAAMHAAAAEVQASLKIQSLFDQNQKRGAAYFMGQK
jgi:hypothetical protein